jgi:hypothetical protein
MKKYSKTRSAKRVRVEVPVHLDQGSGITRDVSSSGVFFFTNQKISQGMSLCFVLELDHVFSGEPVRLRCRGQVVRVEEAGERTGVAISISDFWNAA